MFPKSNKEKKLITKRDRLGRIIASKSLIESFNYMINNVLMDDTKKMLKAVINGQSAMKEELLKKMDDVDKKVDNLEKKVDGGFKTVNERIDKLGKSLAYLEDDAPTRDEFDGLTNKVDKIEKNFITT